MLIPHDGCHLCAGAPRTDGHPPPQVWISYADFEASVEHEDTVAQTRHVYETGEKEVKRGGDKAQRLLLLEAWKEFEEDFGTADTVKRVAAKMPRRVRRRREIFADDGTSEGWEECVSSPLLFSFLKGL